MEEAESRGESKREKQTNLIHPDCATFAQSLPFCSLFLLTTCLRAFPSRLHFRLFTSQQLMKATTSSVDHNRETERESQQTFSSLFGREASKSSRRGIEFACNLITFRRPCLTLPPFYLQNSIATQI